MKTRFTGLAAWSVQRVSAIAMLLCALLFVGTLSLRPIHSYAEWKAWVGHPAVSAAIFALVATLLAHMWVGLRDVLLDYARPAPLRHSLLVALAAGLAGIAAWTLWILLGAHT